MMRLPSKQGTADRPTKTCGSCCCFAAGAVPTWFLSADGGESGECRAEPPRIHGEGIQAGEAEWPVVWAGDWCAAWRPLVVPMRGAA